MPERQASQPRLRERREHGAQPTRRDGLGDIGIRTGWIPRPDRPHDERLPHRVCGVDSVSDEGNLSERRELTDQLEGQIPVRLCNTSTLIEECARRHLRSEDCSKRRLVVRLAGTRQRCLPEFGRSQTLPNASSRDEPPSFGAVAESEPCQVGYVPCVRVAPLAVRGFEEVVTATDDAGRLRSVVAIHDTVRLETVG